MLWALDAYIACNLFHPITNNNARGFVPGFIGNRFSLDHELFRSNSHRTPRDFGDMHNPIVLVHMAKASSSGAW
jgi:hypothetical protein